jgi:DNA-directed RNA polymerase delta subunit
MDELEFSELYEKTKDTISKWLGISDENIENEIMQFY